jgi:hypothetical protein
VDGYRIKYTRDPDAFASPQWPPESLDDLIMATFKDRMIASEDHPGLLRLIGAKLVP